VVLCGFLGRFVSFSYIFDLTSLFQRPATFLRRSMGFVVFSVFSHLVSPVSSQASQNRVVVSRKRPCGVESPLGTWSRATPALGTAPVCG